jgi:hypothetical protein
MIEESIHVYIPKFTLLYDAQHYIESFNAPRHSQYKKLAS